MVIIKMSHTIKMPTTEKHMDYATPNSL